MEKRLRISRNTRISLILSWALALSGVSIPAYSQNSSVEKAPKLVVGITVEGMSEEYIDLLRELFGDNGFNYILANAVTLTDVDYGSLLDGPSYNSIIHTGASPAVNGIPSEYIYNPTTHRAVPTLNSEAPSAADENYSPSRILASTLADEVKIHGDGLGQVHSIAASPAMAITAGGHTPNSTYWINDISGKWTTSTYYHDRPTFIQYRNRMTPVSAKLDTLTWSPTLNISNYPALSSIKKEFPFKVRFLYGDSDRYTRYKSSPVVNDEITDLAIEYIDKLDLGKHEEPDMLNIGYTLQPFPYSNDQNERAQTLDGYLRFDKNLDRLFSAIDRGPGLDRTLFFIVGTPLSSRSRKEDERWRIPTGEFSTKKAISLLNLYLINKYGNGDWITGYNNGYFYLNPNAASTHGADLADVRTDAVSFLRRMSGIAYAYSIDDIIDGKVNEDIIKPRNVRIDAVGDIFISVLPGWEVTEENPVIPAGNQIYRLGSATAPAYILYPKLEKNTVSSVVDARAIAPTIASIMRIRPPNGATLSPIRLKRKENK